MSFLLPCPQCGPRDVYEFRWGGERSSRPPPGSAPAVWTEYLYFRVNAAGSQQEWWYHRMGCRRWFLAVRDTVSNAVERTFWPGGEPEVTSPGVASPRGTGPGVARPEGTRPAPARPGAVNPEPTAP